jgi:hypothetical protein
LLSASDNANKKINYEKLPFYQLSAKYYLLGQKNKVDQSKVNKILFPILSGQTSHRYK